MKRIWAFALFVGFSGFFLHQALAYFFPNSIALAWTITALMIAVLFLSLTINFARTYHQRIVNDAREEWGRRTKVVKVLSELIARGEVIYRRCERQTYDNDPKLGDDLDMWQRGAASSIVHEAGLHESYRDRFYKHSDFGERLPPPNEWISWTHTRIAILREIRQEFEQSPPELASHKAKDNQHTLPPMPASL